MLVYQMKETSQGPSSQRRVMQGIRDACIVPAEPASCVWLAVGVDPAQSFDRLPSRNVEWTGFQPGVTPVVIRWNDEYCEY